MKKIIISVILITASLSLTACGKKTAAPSPRPSATPSATVSVTAAPQKSDTRDSAKTEERSSENAAAAQHESISIINGSSETFYAIYLSDSAAGGLGENIIGDTPLYEGEEIVLPFTGASQEEMTIIAEDEGGVRYSAGGIYLANGLTVELRLENGTLQAIVQ